MSGSRWDLFERFGIILAMLILGLAVFCLALSDKKQSAEIADLKTRIETLETKLDGTAEIVGELYRERGGK